MMNKIIAPGSSLWPGTVRRMEDPDVDWYDGGYCIASGDVRGLTEVPEEEKPRQGELVVTDVNGISHTLKIVAHHAYPIPDGSYALIGCDDDGRLLCDIWVVGWLREDRKFEKLSVFRSADDAEVKLRELGLEKSKVVLC